MKPSEVRRLIADAGLTGTGHIRIVQLDAVEVRSLLTIPWSQSNHCTRPVPGLLYNHDGTPCRDEDATE